MEAKKLYLPEIVGGSYGTFWNFKGRYRICKGSRASKKSKTMGLWTVVNMMQHPDANILCIRKTGRTLQASQFTEIKWAIHRLHVDSFFHCTVNPLEITYKPTGQKIYFRGLDDPLKVTSISVEKGYLCWLWIEEAYEIMNEDDFDILDESIRGEVSADLFKQITLTFNPWNEHIWIKHRFFDEIVGQTTEGKPIYKQRKNVISDDGDILAMTTNYMCNEFLDESDRRLFERMKKNNPRRYQVAGLGNWGIVDGLVYENWTEKKFELDEIKNQGAVNAKGLDFGFTNDPTAVTDMYVNQQQRIIYIWDELYEYGLTNRKIANELKKRGWAHDQIRADSAEPKSIAELRDEQNITKIRPCRKGKDSIMNGISRIQDYQIIIHPRCVNFLTEISNYQFDKDKFGKKLNAPIDDFNHLMDAMRYGLDDLIVPDSFSFD